MTKLCPIRNDACVPECKFARQRITSERWEGYRESEDYDCLLSLAVVELSNIADSLLGVRNDLPRTPQTHEKEETKR